MKRLMIMTACTWTLWAGGACATKPAGQPVPAVPAAAPVAFAAATPAPGADAMTRPVMLADDMPLADMFAKKSDAAAPAAGEPALPPGHPPMGGAKAAAPMGKLPADHPPLPAGHPPMGGARPKAAATRPAGALPTGHPNVQPKVEGSLKVRVVQGTANAPAVGAAAFTFHLFDEHGHPMSEQPLEGKLEPDGTALLTTVPVRTPVFAKVSVTYAGATFEALSDRMDPLNADAEVEVRVFETTDTLPQLAIGMRHLIVTQVPKGVRVEEILMIDNPSDRAYAGKPGPDGKKVSFSLPLPAGASNLELSAQMHDCCNAIKGDQLVSNMPLNPGETQYSFAYTVPASGGKATLGLSAPAPVNHLMLLLPDDGTTVTPSGLTSTGVRDLGKGKKRIYKAATQPAGQVASLTIEGLGQGGPGAAVARAAMGASGIAKAVAGVGLVLILVVGLVVVLIRSAKAKPAVRHA